MDRNEYITFETAKLISQTDFPQEKTEGCSLYVTSGDYMGDLVRYSYDAPERDKKSIAAPTKYAIMEWLRQRDIYVWVVPVEKEKDSTITYMSYIKHKDRGSFKSFSTWNDALEEGIKNAISSYLI